MPPAKLEINLQTCLIPAIIFILPHFFLFTGLLMCVVWSLQSDTVVRPPTIVEYDEALNLFHCFLKRIKTPILTIYALVLDSAVHTLCKGVVSRFVVLGHRYLYTIFLQFLHIQVAAILDTTVRVVDEPREVASTCLFNGHAEGFERKDRC